MERDSGYTGSSSAGGVVLNTPSYVKYYRRPNGIDYSAPAGSSVDGLGTPLYTRKVNVTHDCACSKCCGDNADGITASGKRVAPGMVAMSSYYPFGTVLVINGEVYTVEDRGGAALRTISPGWTSTLRTISKPCGWDAIGRRQHSTG